MKDQSYPVLSHAEVETILDNHLIWIESNTTRGTKADFSGKTIEQYDFSGKNLVCVNFFKSKLRYCRFSGSILNDSKFIAADVFRCDFTRASLDSVDFSWSNIKGTLFTDSKYLTVKNFRRADLSSSVFPSEFSFAGVVEYTDHLIKKSRNLFGVMLSISITTITLLLFGSAKHSSGLISLSLPLLSREVNLEAHIGLLVNLFILAVIGLFYSLSLSAVKRQLDKLPSVMPDGRFSHETVFPWFETMWIGEIWLIDYRNASISEKVILWQRILVLASVSSAVFASVFIVILLYLTQWKLLFELIRVHMCLAGVSIGIVTMLALWVALKFTSRFYVLSAVIGAFIALIAMFFSTDVEMTVLFGLSIVLAWWFNFLIFETAPFSLDISAPDSRDLEAKLKEIRRYVDRRFVGTNVLLGLFSCSAAALYVFHYRP